MQDYTIWVVARIIWLICSLYMCLMAKRFGEALSVEEASKRIRNSDWDEYLTSKYILLMTIWMNILPV